MQPDTRVKTSASYNIRSSNHRESINTVSYSVETANRFHAKYERRGDHECWFWTSNKQLNGYGTMSVGGKPRKAHRIAYELAYGPIPAGASICHRCDQPDCVNPAHLFAGDHTVNMRDAASKRRLSVPRPNAQRVSDADCAAIVALAKAGKRLRDIAADYGVSHGYVSLLISGKRRQFKKASAA
jgi:hypothetical protein